jgi:hypothetical protein
MTGCDSNASDEASAEAAAYAAEAVAAAMGEETGGVADPLADAVQVATASGVAAGIGADKAFFDAMKTSADDVELTYDTETMTWLMNVDRTPAFRRSNVSGSFSRSYTFQFLDANGTPMRTLYVGDETADTILFTVQSGTGSYDGPRVSHELSALSANWEISGLTTDTITITGTYMRDAADALTTLASTRTFDGVVEATVDVVVPVNAADPVTAMSGTVEGRYQADITFESAALYDAASVDETFTATLSNGQVTIEIDGDTFEGDLVEGELNSTLL